MKPVQRSPITQHLISSHTSSFPIDQFDTPPTLDTQGSEFTHPLMHSTTVAASVSSPTITNQKAGVVSHDALRTPPRRQTTPTGNVFRVPAPKSNVSVRRSARIASTRKINDHTVSVCVCVCVCVYVCVCVCVCECECVGWACTILLKVLSL